MADETPKLARGGAIGGPVHVTVGREGCEQVVPLRRDAATGLLATLLRRPRDINPNLTPEVKPFEASGPGEKI